MNNDILKMIYLLDGLLPISCPVLSGNMKSHISIVEVKDREATICIEAPFYDVAEFERTGKLVYIGSPQKYPDVTDYAMWVNEKGAFGKHNKSQFWVNRVCNEVAETIASEIGAEVDNKLPLT